MSRSKEEEYNFQCRSVLSGNPHLRYDDVSIPQKFIHIVFSERVKVWKHSMCGQYEPCSEFLKDSKHDQSSCEYCKECFHKGIKEGILGYQARKFQKFQMSMCVFQHVGADNEIPDQFS